jgi:ubiquinone/menaquinone biosynthesis C-methylase UbiE
MSVVGPVLHTDARPALQYHRCTVRYLLDPWVEDLVERAQLRPGQRVLDLACGTGAVARVAIERVQPAGLVVGLDLDAEMLRVARNLPAATTAALEWQQGDAVALPLADASFDAVLCQQGLQFFADRTAALRQIKRVLMHHGRLALAVWNRLARNPYSATLVEVFGRYLGQEIAERGRSPFALGDRDVLRRLLTQAGFRPVKVEVIVKLLPLPPLREFIPEHLAAMALAPVFSAMNPARRAAMIRDAELNLTPYTTANGAALPFEVLMAVAE